MLSNDLELTLRRSLSLATYFKHEYASYEHLLLALIDDKDVKNILLKNNISIELLREKLTGYLENNLIDLVRKDITDTKPTAGFQRIIQRAVLHGQANKLKVITGVNVLAEFFFEHDSYALMCLKEFNLSRQAIINYSKNKEENNSSAAPLGSAQSHIITANNFGKENLKEQTKTGSAEDALNPEKYCVNLNKKAMTDTIDCLVGRQAEIQRTIEILCRRKKNNVILVGEPGVGKTAIAEGLAALVIGNKVPKILKDAVIYSLDIGSLVAGTKFRGDFEERINNLLSAMQKNPNAILFIDEIHMIIGAGSTNNGAMDASNLLKPALTKGIFKCIGSTTFKEYHNHFEKDAALVRRFQKIVVSEPTEETALEILTGLKGYYEKHHNVIYEDSALKAAINLSERFIHDRHLPDKAIDLIDEAGARSKIGNDTSNASLITRKDIEFLLSSILNVPNIQVKSDHIAQLKNLSGELKKLIFGQDEAIETLCSNMKLAHAGLRKETGPIGCYMFAGPTGVGKTELSKQLAALTDMKLIKFDMSEYSERNSVSKLIGSSPGYVGYEQGGLLTGEVDKFPYAVVLFDEIEKAHPEILNLLLQIADEGKLTDNTGKQINFSHAMIILTTNITPIEEKIIGFSENEYKEFKEVANQDIFNDRFSPEFISRLDKIIIFNSIANIGEKIITKKLKELAKRLASKKVKFNISNSAKKHFVEKYFTKNQARELDRAVDANITQIIADEILFGKLKDGGSVSVDYSKKTKKLTFGFLESQKVKNKELEVI